MAAQGTSTLLSSEDQSDTPLDGQDCSERFRVQRQQLYGGQRQRAFHQLSSDDELPEVHQDRRLCEASSLEKIINDLFQVTESVPDGGSPDQLAGDLEPTRRSVPLSLVLSSLYAIALLQLYLSASWWIAFREQDKLKAWLTITIAHVSSVPLYLVAVCSAVGGRTDTCSVKAAKVLTFTLVSPFFNIVPLLQLVLRLKDSMQLYRTTGRKEEGARLRLGDAAIFSNLMWFVTLSCVPQTVFQISEVLRIFLQEQQAYADVSLKLFAACLSILLTSFTCVQFSNLQENSQSPPRISAFKRALEHLSWLLLLTARTLACSIILTKAPRLGYIFFVTFTLHISLYVFYKTCCSSCRENVFCHPLCVVTQSAVSTFFLRGGTRDKQRLWRVFVFLTLQEAENIVFVLVPFWDDGLAICEIDTYIKHALGVALSVHCGTFMTGSVALSVACYLKHPDVYIEI